MYVFEDLMKVLKDSNRPYDFDKITEAYRYAEKAHDGQMRQSGEPYITHPIAVAQILVELGMDTETICAGLLHDVVEDTSSTIEEIKKIFGADVALMVDGVTKLTKLSYSSKEQRQAENVRKMLLAMAKDVRVIIVKLSDRLHNMRTGEYWKEYKRREKALETDWVSVRSRKSWKTSPCVFWTRLPMKKLSACSSLKRTNGKSFWKPSSRRSRNAWTRNT